MDSHRNIRILIVDDDTQVASILQKFLEASYQTHVAHSGEKALALLAEEAFDLVLLDVYLPDVNGLDMLELLRDKHPALAVMMLTGNAVVEDAVQAMQQGAIDYLEKPISKAKMLDRVQHGLTRLKEELQQQAKLKKLQKLLAAGLQQLDDLATDLPVELPDPPATNGHQPDPDRYLTYGKLEIDLYRREATLNGEPLDLTAGEYDLLLCLAQEAPRVLSPSEIVKETRGYECSLREARELVRWQIYLLRQKVEVDPAAPKYVLNVRGRGYMWAS